MLVSDAGRKITVSAARLQLILLVFPLPYHLKRAGKKQLEESFVLFQACSSR